MSEKSKANKRSRETGFPKPRPSEEYDLIGSKTDPAFVQRVVDSYSAERSIGISPAEWLLERLNLDNGWVGLSVQEKLDYLFKRRSKQGIHPERYNSDETVEPLLYPIDPAEMKERGELDMNVWQGIRNIAADYGIKPPTDPKPGNPKKAKKEDRQGENGEEGEGDGEGEPQEGEGEGESGEGEGQGEPQEGQFQKDPAEGQGSGEPQSRPSSGGGRARTRPPKPQKAPPEPKDGQGQGKEKEEKEEKEDKEPKPEKQKTDKGAGKPEKQDKADKEDKDEGQDGQGQGDEPADEEGEDGEGSGGQEDGEGEDKSEYMTGSRERTDWRKPPKVIDERAFYREWMDMIHPPSEQFIPGDKTISYHDSGYSTRGHRHNWDWMGVENQLVARLREELQSLEQRRIRRNLDAGLVDMTKLPDIAMLTNLGQAYCNVVDGRRMSTAVSIIIDNSGSMTSGIWREGGSVISAQNAAAGTAFMLGRICEGLRIPVEIASFTGYSVSIKSFFERMFVAKDRLQTLPSCDSTLCYQAGCNAAQRLAVRREKRKCLFVVTDGDVGDSNTWGRDFPKQFPDIEVFVFCVGGGLQPFTKKKPFRHAVGGLSGGAIPQQILESMRAAVVPVQDMKRWKV